MSRRKRTVVEQATADAAKELGLPPTHWTVRRLSTMTILLAVAQNKFSATQSSQSAADILSLMDGITKLRAEAKLVEPVDIRVQFVEGYHGVCSTTCPHCGKTSRHELSDRPFAGPGSTSANERTTSLASPGAEPSTADVSRKNNAEGSTAAGANATKSVANAPPNVVPLPVTVQRENVSASPFHNQLINGHEIPPLKRQGTSGYATGVSAMALNDRNPNRNRR